MKRREFGQYCGLARALELVGERWTLLVIRELLARPCRYTDLLDNLPGIPTNVLSARLKELEAEGIVERQVAPAPQRGVRYTLTDEGRSLEPAVLSLARWGNARLGERHGEMVPASTLAMSLRATFNRQAAEEISATWEIHAADATVFATVGSGELSTGVGTAPNTPDLVMTIAGDEDEVPTFRDVISAIRGGQADLAGRRPLAEAFLHLFSPSAA
jgi:DNA-binding HxlR family transcriptional regulator